MPYLNWAGEPRISELRISMTETGAAELIASLEPVLARPGAAPGVELRLDLPRGHTVFWKLRESESRLLLAHPQQEQWVATVALEPAHAKLLLEALRGLRDLRASGSVRLTALFPVGTVSNVEIVVEVA